MAMRIGGIVLLVIGAALAVLGAALRMALLGQPVPSFPGGAQVIPALVHIGEKAGLPAGSGWAELAGNTFGQMALFGLVAGALLMIAGLWQFVTGRRSGAILVLVTLLVCGFAVLMVLAP